MIRAVSALIGLIGLGIVMGFSPTLVATTLRILTGTPRPDRAVSYMLIGLILGSTAVLLLLQVVDPRSIEHALSEDADRLLVQRSVDLSAGAVFLAATILLSVRARRPRRASRPRRTPSGKPSEMMLLGASSAILSVSSIATMYMTARVIRGMSDEDPIRVLSYLVFALALALPYIALVVIWRRIPALASRITSLLARLSAADLRRWEAVLTAIAALVFLGLGIFGKPDL